MTTPTAAALARLPHVIAAEIGAGAAQVQAAIALLDEGSTGPFIARYRKEATGGLDDTQLRTLAERLVYLREMEARRAAIVGSITEQGKMTEAVALVLAKATTKAELEDIYLPFKPKRRTKAMIARENGLQPLHDLGGSQPDRRIDMGHRGNRNVLKQHGKPANAGETAGRYSHPFEQATKPWREWRSGSSLLD